MASNDRFYDNRDMVDLLNFMGVEVKSVQALNLILQEMGIIKKDPNGWLTTQKGLKYSGYSGPVYRPDMWNSDLARDVLYYIRHVRNKT